MLLESWRSTPKRKKTQNVSPFTLEVVVDIHLCLRSLRRTLLTVKSFFVQGSGGHGAVSGFLVGLGASGRVDVPDGAKFEAAAAPGTLSSWPRKKESDT